MQSKVDSPIAPIWFSDLEMDDEANDELFGTGDGSEEVVLPKQKKKKSKALNLDLDENDELAGEMADLDLGGKKKKRKDKVTFLQEVETVSL